MLGGLLASLVVMVGQAAWAACIMPSQANNSSKLNNANLRQPRAEEDELAKGWEAGRLGAVCIMDLIEKIQ